MRYLFCLGSVCAVLFAAPAGAQVTIDLQALQALPGHEPPAHHATPSHRNTRRAVRTHREVARTLPLPPIPPGEAAAVATAAPPAAVAPPAAAPAGAAAAAPKPPAPPPAHGPAVAAIGPLPAVPAVPPAPPAPTLGAPPPPAIPPPVAPAAPAAPRSAAVQFAKGQSTVDSSASQALTALAHTAATSPNATVNVLAYAPADPTDPSASRRMSLERALAIRTALMAGGLPSARIYLRALGSSGTTTPDRADVTIMGADLPATAQASTGQADAGKGKQQ